LHRITAPARRSARAIAPSDRLREAASRSTPAQHGVPRTQSVYFTLTGTPSSGRSAGRASMRAAAAAAWA
jgi:hypothetical protein